MTALLALEEGGLDEWFAVDGQAIRVEGSSMGLQEGDRVTLRALCGGMLLASGNDAANAAAVRCAGSTAAFVEEMNRKAAAIGMENTCFVTPSGLDAEGHQSTAADMALLMAEALQNEDFAALAGSKTLALEYGNPPYRRTLTNHNKLRWSCEGMVAGKTGFTKKAGRCLVTAARRQGVTLICATLGCPDDWQVHTQLYDRCFGALVPVEAASLMPGLELPAVGAGHKVPLTLARDQTLFVTAGELERLEAHAAVPPFLYAPVERGETVGRLDILLDGRTLWQLPLAAGQEAALSFPPRQEPTGLWAGLKGLFAP